jgi:hypothetical protein
MASRKAWARALLSDATNEKPERRKVAGLQLRTRQAAKVPYFLICLSFCIDL